MAPSVHPPARLLAFRWHLVGLVALSLLPLVLFGAALIGRIALEERGETEQQLVAHAQVLARTVDREVAGGLRALETLARSEQLQRGDLDGFRREAVRVDGVQPAWIAVVLHAPDGRRLVDTRTPTDEGSTVEPASFAEVVRTGLPTVGNLVRTQDGATWAFPLRVPVLAEGRLQYVLSAAVSAAEIGRAVAAGSPAEVAWTRTVVDGGGRIVARSRSPEDSVGCAASSAFLEQTGAGADGLFRDTALEGTEAAVGFARAPLTGWIAAVVAPTSLVDGPVRRLTGLLAAAGVASLLLSVSAAFVLSRRFSGAVGSAAQAAQELAGGSAGEVEHRGIREVAELGDALASSASLLEKRRDAVQRHLEEARLARRDAEASSRAKDEFLAMLGHELRNPLSPILTALHLLRQRGVGFGREHEIIARQVGHLVRLVDDLLDVARLTRASVRLSPERLELGAAVHRAVEMTAPLLDERRDRLTVDVPQGLVVLADPGRLAQVIANLLTNAARYTPRGGNVSVAGRREADRVVLDVTDDGQGIAPDLLPRIFDLFVQGPRKADRSEGGLGIGLALVKSLVSLHGGAVEARSEGPGRGSTFRISLPAASVPAALAAAAAPAAVEAASAHPGGGARAPGAKLRVLVVDDNGDAAALLAEFLERAGHDVTVARDGPEALAAAAARPPDVAVLDVGLPVMDGYEVAVQLARRLGATAPAIIGVTGYGQARDRARGREAGFLHHFVKPADPAELLAAVEEAGHLRTERRA